MCFHTPAHKQTDPAKKPGQIVNPIPQDIDTTDAYDSFLLNAAENEGMQTKTARLPARFSASERPAYTGVPVGYPGVWPAGRY